MLAYLGGHVLVHLHLPPQLPPDLLERQLVICVDEPIEPYCVKDLPVLPRQVRNDGLDELSSVSFNILQCLHFPQHY